MNNEIKERPIIFSQSMVRAILDGRKSQTRMAIKLPKERGEWEPSIIGGVGVTYSDGTPCPEMPCIWNTTTGTSLLCPHGKIGERLWVRETFAVYGDIEKHVIHYKADIERGSGWKPSIHMPRWASRILLEITDIRVERLQDISEEDAKLEGSRICDYNGRMLLDQRSNQGGYKWGYRSIWESINGQGSWGLNPWVWVVEFRRID